MHYKNTLFLLLLFIFGTVYSQDIASSNENYFSNKTTATTENLQLNGDYQKKWSFGGSVGLSFWNNGTDILIAPKAFYNISPIVITGVGLTYIYSDYKTSFYTYKSNSYGGSIFFAARPIEFIQISAEYEGLQTSRRGNFDEDYWNNSIYLGLSFVSGPVSFGVRYDVLFDSDRSPYSSAINPVIGFYF
ncbi:hypothetical protein SAMN06265371_110115 [Lutibacter agarilyticus]|uniref:Outer membrane protein beta-barrel domain-containing protein n=1 Tax=Lutibacter agarilyticus TaxID=1109740 RepID=A0A238YSK2_9FLAO|nr:alpha-ketoglutarate decarboxylase [Lutibacter agarilyticus]SNR73671.1 hypothetical protein SAMN06265371_110115 [Lutibacter agarilyticus]